MQDTYFNVISNRIVFDLNFIVCMKKKVGSSNHKKNQKQNSDTNEPTVRFNLNILHSERMRMVKLQAKCFREHRVCNLSEILRAGIAAMEKLSETEINEIITNLKEL
jgi:hypothetical protein